MKNRLISLFLVCTLLLFACQSAPKKNDASSFQSLTDELFSSLVTSDALTLHYTLQTPSNYGITKLPNGFCSLSAIEDKQSGAEMENLKQRLLSIHKHSLSLQNQILYDTLQDFFQEELLGENYLTLTPALNPSHGIQAQLPVLLSEFSIQNTSDLSQYFSLLKTLPDYFHSLVKWEEQKKQSGTMLCRASLQHIIRQCQDFLQKKGVNIIHHRFRQQIQQLNDINEKALLKKHRKMLETKVIPAYNHMITKTKELLNSAPSDGSLASYPAGKSYYEYLFRQKTGSSDAVSVWKSRLQNQLKICENTLLSLATKNPTLLRTSEECLPVSQTPASILSSLQQKCQADFPTCPETSFQIHYIDSSLEEYLSPAFYLTPPIDCTDTNCIYLNNSSKYRHTSLYNTLAHEGYPGHLYQNCYLRHKKLPALRYLLDYPGYTEGYATYAEIYAYSFLPAKKDEITILEQNAISTLCLYALCDIGIHYEHWSKSYLQKFLERHGVSDTSAITAVYETIIDSPGSYLPYTIGYLEIKNLEKHYFSLHKTANKKEFHTYLLNMGPTSFSILKTYCK